MLRNEFVLFVEMLTSNIVCSLIDHSMFGYNLLVHSQKANISMLRLHIYMPVLRINNHTTMHLVYSDKGLTLRGNYVSILTSNYKGMTLLWTKI